MLEYQRLGFFPSVSGMMIPALKGWQPASTNRALGDKDQFLEMCHAMVRACDSLPEDLPGQGTW